MVWEKKYGGAGRNTQVGMKISPCTLKFGQPYGPIKAGSNIPWACEVYFLWYIY